MKSHRKKKKGRTKSQQKYQHMLQGRRRNRWRHSKEQRAAQRMHPFKEKPVL